MQQEETTFWAVGLVRRIFVLEFIGCDVEWINLAQSLMRELLCV